MSVKTEADKKGFIGFMIGVLDKNADTIANEGKQGVTFDTAGNKKVLDTKNQAVITEEAKETAAAEQHRKQTALANAALADGYKGASQVAEAIIAHMPDGHKLSEIIRKERGGMHQTPPTPPAGN